MHTSSAAGDRTRKATLEICKPFSLSWRSRPCARSAKPARSPAFGSRVVGTRRGENCPRHAAAHRGYRRCVLSRQGHGIFNLGAQGGCAGDVNVSSKRGQAHSDTLPALTLELRRNPARSNAQHVALRCDLSGDIVKCGRCRGRCAPLGWGHRQRSRAPSLSRSCVDAGVPRLFRITRNGFRPRCIFGDAAARFRRIPHLYVVPASECGRCEPHNNQSRNHMLCRQSPSSAARSQAPGWFRARRILA